MTSSPSDIQREYQLIEKLELRIASAETAAKFESILQKFLAPLLLKLASENERNRNLTIKVCQYVNQRLKIDSTITLPVHPLLKTFREAQNAFVKRFALIFIEQGLNRQSSSDAVQTIPELLKSSVPESDQTDATGRKIWSIAFDFLLHVLPDWTLPSHATKEDDELKATFSMSSAQLKYLSVMLSKFLLYDPKTTSPPEADFQTVFEKHFRVRSKVTLSVAKFLFSSVFSDKDRLVPATILSVDANSPASSLADAMFKQCNFDLESDESVDELFALFENAKAKLRIKILSLLSRSRASTDRASKILQIVESQLFQETKGLEAAKLRTAIFSYLNWAVRVSKTLASVSASLQIVLRSFIELQGWPVMQESSHAEVDLRSKAYEGIGLLANSKALHDTESSSHLLNLIGWLFTSLRCDTTRDIRSSIDESMSRILNLFSTADQIDRAPLKELLLWNAMATDGDEDPVYFQPTKNSTTYAAVRFANRCLPFADVDARYIDIVAIGMNDRREIVEEALRGLDPYWHASNSRLLGQGDLKIQHPDFASFVSRTFGNSSTTSVVENSPASLTAAVVFGRNLLASKALMQNHVSVDNGVNWKGSIDTLISNDPSARKILRQNLVECNSETLLSLLTGAIYGLSLEIGDCADIALELVSLCSNDVLSNIMPSVLSRCQNASLNAVVQLRASRICGIILSLTGQGMTCASDAIEKCSSWSTAIGQDAVATKGYLLVAGFALTRGVLRDRSNETSPLFESLMTIIKSIVTDSRDQTLKHAAYTVLGQISLCSPSIITKEETVRDMIDTLLITAKKEDEAAVACIGRLINGIFSSDNSENIDTITARLFALHEVRKTEFHFALGEAFAVAAMGFHSKSTIMEFDVDNPLPDHGYHPELFLLLLRHCIEDCKATKPSLKKAAGVWLLSLIQFCNNTELLKPHLRDCQTAFASLLNNRDDVVQETGSRGLSLVYENGDKELRDDLVRDLVQSFTGGSAKMSGTVNEDTQLFEAGTLPTEGGQSVTTYKDIVSLATEMGDPSLVYRFMNLASSNAIWTSRAAFGRFGLSGVLADSTYLTENKKFYPKLFRYRFDPNPNVQRSMEEIWKALVKDPNKVIDENFDLILEDLLKSVVSGKEWRAREASCAAIADLIQGREVEKFQGYLDEIWQVAFKVLDDVKETVRLAAMKLCRTLTSMLIRNLEVGDGTTNRATIMLNRAIPFLLQQMEGGSAQEVQQYAIVTLLEVVKKCPAKTLQPFAPTILETLILSLSSLEHESINYLHLNADKYGLTAEKLDKMRVSSINASPVTEAIERCLESLTTNQNRGVNVNPDDPTDRSSDLEHTVPQPMQDAMLRLERAFKTAIGLPSKVGLGRVIVTLVVRHHAMFRPFADRFTQLTRKHILDRNATISVSFSMTLAYLLRLASDKEIKATNQYAQKLYFESQELSHRAVAGEITQAISKTSNDVFMKFATTLLPFAFVGHCDLDADVRGRFEPAWKDNIGGSRALNLYLSEIVSLISTHIKSSLWPIRQACSLAVAELVTSMDSVEQYTGIEAGLLWHVVEESLNGKTWDGKERVISAFPGFVKKARPIWPEHGSKMKTIALREAKRTNAVYRPLAVIALGEFAAARTDLDLTREVLELLTNVGEELSESADDMEVDGVESSSSVTVEQTWIAVIKCLFQILSVGREFAVLDQAMQLVTKARSNQSTKIDVEIYNGARQFITQATANLSATSPGTWRGPGEESESGSGLGSGLGSSSGGGGQVHQQQRRHHAALAGEKEKDGDGQGDIARFLHDLVPATFGSDAARHPSDHENIRKSRVELAWALADSRLLNSATRAILVSILDGWSRSERSRPLKTELEKAAEVMKTPPAPHMI